MGGNYGYLRVGLDYREEVHRPVERFNPRHGYLMQWLEWWTDKMDLFYFFCFIYKFYKCLKLEFLKVEFLVHGFEVVHKT